MDSGKRRGAQRSYPERAHALGLLETWERQAYLGGIWRGVSKGCIGLRHKGVGLARDPLWHAGETRRRAAQSLGKVGEARLWREPYRGAAGTDQAGLGAGSGRPRLYRMGRGRKGRRRRSRTSHTVRAPARRRARAARGGRLDRGLYPGHGPRDDPRFDEWIFSHHERTYDARIERY